MNTDYRRCEVSAFERCVLAIAIIWVYHMGRFEPSGPWLHLNSGDCFFDKVKPGPLAFIYAQEIP